MPLKEAFCTLFGGICTPLLQKKMKTAPARDEKGLIKDLTFCCRPPIRKKIPDDACSRPHCVLCPLGIGI